jgi:glycine cleavage system H protein
MVKVEDYNLPDELYYTLEHTWARVEPDGSVTVGADDFLQKLAKEIRYVDLPFEGDPVEHLKTFATLESEKWVGKLLAPVSGTVAAVNSKLLDQPKLVNTDPYGEGWLIKITPSNLNEDLKKLIHGAENVTKLIHESIAKYLKK